MVTLSLGPTCLRHWASLSLPSPEVRVSPEAWQPEAMAGPRKVQLGGWLSWPSPDGLLGEVNEVTQGKPKVEIKADGRGAMVPTGGAEAPQGGRDSSLVSLSLATLFPFLFYPEATGILWKHKCNCITLC